MLIDLMTFVFQVPTHKTQGVGTIAVSPEIYLMLKNFIQMSKRIPNFTPDADRSVFTSWPKSDGDNQIVPLNSSQVNMTIHRLWAQGPVKNQ